MYSILQLSNLPLFDQIPSYQLHEMRGLFREQHFSRGSVLLTPEQPCGHVYIVTRGAVKVIIQRKEGSDMLLTILGVGEVLGELSAIDGCQHSALVMALEDTDVVGLSVNDFAFLLKTQPSVSWNLIKMLTRRLRRVTGQAEILATLDVTGRLSRQLLNFAEDYGQPREQGGIAIPIQLTQADLASLVGASREKVNRVFHRLKLQGALMSDGRGRIILLNTILLAQLSG